MEIVIFREKIFHFLPTAETTMNNLITFPALEIDIERFHEGAAGAFPIPGNS